jgi:hypothetical protein
MCPAAGYLAILYDILSLYDYTGRFYYWEVFTRNTLKTKEHSSKLLSLL